MKNILSSTLRYLLHIRYYPMPLSLKVRGIVPWTAKPTKTCLLMCLCLACFSVRSHAQQTLCQQYGGAAVNVTIGTPINNNQQGTIFLSNVPTGATYQNQKIRINGILKVDVPFTLTNCTVELERGALIVTDGAGSITSANSRYYSCERMWQGFYIKTASNIDLRWGEIEDAEAAVTLDDGAPSLIVGVLFDRNHIGIRNGSATAGPAAINLAFFGGNTFDCSSALSLPFHSNLSPAYTGTGYAGIYMNTAVCTIPGFLQPNGFQNMHFGIASENSDLSVSVCYFQNMVAHPTLFGRINGIRASGGALSAGYCNVLSMLNGHGIWADKAELNLSFNTFNVNGLTGITSINNLLTDFIFIKSNTLTLQNNANSGAVVTDRTGILVDRNSRSAVGNINLTSFEISDNIITINGLNSGAGASFFQRGILIEGPVPSMDIGLISNNTINANTRIIHRQDGIEVRAGLPDRFRVLGNDITYSDPIGLYHNLRWGISMLYGTGVNHRLQGNNSVALGGGNGAQGYCGFHLEDMPNVTTCSNSVNDFEHGFHFYCPCNNLGFWENQMNNHYNAALRVQNNVQNGHEGFIGTHIRTHNRWSTIELALNNSTWNQVPHNLLVLPVNSLPVSSTNWFPPSFFTFELDDETLCVQPTNYEGEGGGEMTGYDHWVKAGADGATQTAGWEARRALMYKLMRYTALNAADTSVSNFYNAQINTTAGKFAQVDYMILQSAQQITESQNNNTSMLAAERNSLLAQLHTLDEGYGALTTLSTAQVAAKNALLNAWKANFSNRLALKQQIAVQRLYNIQQAQQLLQSIVTSTQQEASWKTIQSIRLNRTLGAGNDETSWNQLRSIAALCPQTVGSSAIAALYMLPIEEIDVLLPNEEIGLSAACGARTEERRLHNDAPLQTIRLSPNPTNDWLSAELPVESDGRWDVLDIQGRIALKGFIAKSKSFVVATASLPDGVYVLVVTTQEGTRHTHKFLVSR